MCTGELQRDRVRATGRGVSRRSFEVSQSHSDKDDINEVDPSYDEDSQYSPTIQTPARMELLTIPTANVDDISLENTAKYEAFKAIAEKTGCCVKWRQDESCLNAVVFLPTLDSSSLCVGKGPPVKVQVSGGGQDGIQIKCSCELSRIAKIVNASRRLGAEGGYCWHERFCCEGII